MSKSLVWLAPLLLLWAGCGGPPAAAATAIPADIVRPVQSTPVYPKGANVFSLLTPAAGAQFVTPAEAELQSAAGVDPAVQQRQAARLLFTNQTPSAMGIAPGGTAIYAQRGGRALASVPVGGVLTVTGKSADGGWYSVYNEDAVYGWTPAGQLRVYGGDALVVVEEAPDPAPIATLLAQGDVPVRVLDDLMAQIAATGTQNAQQPAAPPASPTAAPLAAEDAAEETVAEETVPLSTPVAAIVTSDGRLNVRAEAATTAAIVRKLNPGAVVTILGRSDDGQWLRIRLDDGAAGWIAAEFVTLR